MRTAQDTPDQAPRRLPTSRLMADRPAGGDLGGRDRREAGGQHDQDHDQAHRLVQDHRRERGESEQADQQRQAELRAAQPDHPAQNTDGRARTQEAEKRARIALAELAKTGKPISFTAVTRHAGVSTDFLYRSPELRTQIERHRAKGGTAPAAPADRPGDFSTSAAVRALSARLARQQEAHREEVARFRRAPEVAQGENLDLRRRLARYEAG